MTEIIETTETATETATTATKVKKTPVNYPFESKTSILAKINASDSYMLSCLQIMYTRQTEHEQNTKSTLNRNHRGFMSSHAVNGSTLAVKAQNEGLTAEEIEKARGIVSRYGKQLASHFRELAVERDPSLASIAAIFGV